MPKGSAYSWIPAERRWEGGVERRYDGSFMKEEPVEFSFELVNGRIDEFRGFALAAKDLGEGEVRFDNLTYRNVKDYGFSLKTHSKRLTEISGKMEHGYINKALSTSRFETQFVGINFSNVTTVSGETYLIGHKLKDMGFVWDAKSRVYRRG